MKRLLLISAFQLISISAFSRDRMDALSMLETGDNDKAIGSKGEVSRYQVMPAYWPGGDPRDPKTARAVAESIMAARIANFSRTTHHAPSDFEWSLLWHCPARVHRPTASDRDYATRFVNLTK